MEQPANSSENSRPDGAEPASRTEGESSAGEHKREERLDSEALIAAANRGELARVKEIIEGMKTNGVNINHQGNDGCHTALIWASLRGRKKVVIELLKVDGLDVNVQNNYGRTALIWACIYGHTVVALELSKVNGIIRVIYVYYTCNIRVLRVYTTHTYTTYIPAYLPTYLQILHILHASHTMYM